MQRKIVYFSILIIGVALAAFTTWAQQQSTADAVTRDLITSMQKQLQDVKQLAQQARADKDVIRLNCVNMQLTTLRGLRQVADQKVVQLRAARVRQDTQSETALRALLTQLHHRALLANEEAHNCVGQIVGFVGKTDVRVEVEGELPSTDTTTVGDDYEAFPQFPPLASAWR